MALTKVSTDGVKDDAITKTKIPANQIEASELADNAVDTNAIADQAVALSKLPHGTSSNNGKFLRANNGADPTFETVNTDLVSDTSPQLGGDLQSNGNNILLADSDVLVAGSNTDLKIYHEGGGGDNIIKNNVANKHLKILHNDDSPSAIFYNNTSVVLYNAGSSKFETTSNGIKVIGEADAGGNVASGNIQMVRSDGYKNTIGNNFASNAYDSRIEFGVSDGSTSGGTNRVASISYAGISFGSDIASANRLDDYEEGTWTPTLHGTWYNSGVFNNAVYTKIGRLVTVSFDLYRSANNMGWQSGASIRGFPFGVYSSGYITTATLTTFSYTSSSARFVENYFDSYSGGNLYLHTNSQSSNIRHLWCNLTYTT